MFKGVSAEHVHSMAMRLGSPRFMLHDLRKMLATVGEKLGGSSAVLRRILNHTAPKTDVLHRHYVGLGVGDASGSAAWAVGGSSPRGLGGRFAGPVLPLLPTHQPGRHQSEGLLTAFIESFKFKLPNAKEKVKVFPCVEPR